jgi:hypothetical protein
VRSRCRTRADTHHRRPCWAVASASGVCRTPGLYSPVWVPDSGYARTPEPPDANQPPGVVLRSVNRLAHLRLHRHGSLRTGDRPHGIREPGDACPGPDGKRVIGLSHMANTSRDRCSEDQIRGGVTSGLAAPARDLRAPCPTSKHGATPPMATAGHLWNPLAINGSPPARWCDHHATHLVFSCLPMYRLVAADRHT